MNESSKIFSMGRKGVRRKKGEKRKKMGRSKTGVCERKIEGGNRDRRLLKERKEEEIGGGE